MDIYEVLDQVISGEPVLPDEAVDIYPFSAGQARYDAAVEVAIQTHQ